MVTTAADAVFLDTGVLVHASATGSPFFQRARDVLRRVEKTGTAAWISRQVLREFLAVVTRPQTFSAPVPPEVAAEGAAALEARFSVAEDGPAVTTCLLEIIVRYGVRGRQTHDANIVATMMTYGIGRLLTLNPADFPRFEPAVVVEAG